MTQNLLVLGHIKLIVRLLSPPVPLKMAHLMYLSSYLKKKIVWKKMFRKKIGLGIPKTEEKNIKWQNFKKSKKWLTNDIFFQFKKLLYHTNAH